MNNFYILGTKYGDKNNQDVSKYLPEKEAVSIGFAWSTDLSKYYNGNFTELNALLKNNGEKPSTIAQVKKFLSLKPGDLIALKSTGSPKGKIANLEIIGYAVVVQRNGIVYRHDPEKFPLGLGHLINVDFLELDIERKLQLGYGQTVHKLINVNHIDLIFGDYSKVLSQNNITSSGTKKKNTLETVVTVSANFIRKAIHNKIQQGVYEKMVTLFGEDAVKMEENFVDIIFTTDEFTELIEVKPYHSATYCIREGLGQLLSYHQKHYQNRKKVHLVIIGRNKPNSADKDFIEFIQKTINVNFIYRSWEQLGSH